MKNKKLFTFLGLAFLLVVWFVLSLVLNNYVVPTIWSTFKTLGLLLISSHTYVVIGASLLRLLIAIVCCLLLSLILAFLSSASIKVRDFIAPIMTVVKSIPVVAIIIIILMIVKVKYASMIILSLVVLPLMYSSILNAIINIPRNIQDDIKTMTSLNIYTYIHVIIPLIWPYLLTSLLSSIGLGFKVLVMSEFIAAPKYSMAREMSAYQAAFDMAGIFAWTIIMLLFVFIIEEVVKKINKPITKKRN